MIEVFNSLLSYSLDSLRGGGMMVIEFSEERYDHLQKMWNSPLQDATNKDYGGSTGIQTDFELEIES